MKPQIREKLGKGLVNLSLIISISLLSAFGLSHLGMGINRILADKEVNYNIGLVNEMGEEKAEEEGRFKSKHIYSLKKAVDWHNAMIPYMKGCNYVSAGILAMGCGLGMGRRSRE